ncbi:metallophosphoesterase [Lutibacter sp.]
MGRESNLNFLFSFLLTLLVSSCATYNAQYHKSVTAWEQHKNDVNAPIEHVFYLIGDAGNATMHENLSHLSLLKKELAEAPINSTLLFLGDNIYEKGMPKKGTETRMLAEHRINAQLDLIEHYKGHTIFIPGNHDYYSNGIKGLKREEKYIEKKLNTKKSFLPKNGCPLEKITISKNTILVIVDSQWYLENWNNNPTMNDDCEIKTREMFFDEFESIIKKNTSKTILIAIHHPIFSNGSHGGQFSFKSQLYPVNTKIPLPVLGSAANLLRKTSGISPQDMINPLYTALKSRLLTISQRANNTIFISGHEHNLQYLIKNGKPQIISGSGSKISAARAINGGLFSYGGLGYAKLITYKNGASWVYYYTEENQQQKLLFKTEIHPASLKSTLQNYPNHFPDYSKAAVYKPSEVSKNSVYTWLWGKHYRKYYGTKVLAKTVLLDTLLGGLHPVRKGGGNQSKSLRLVDKNNKEYVMRALRKSATQYLQAVAYKNKYIGHKFDDTFTEDLLMDIYTTAHPYAPFAVNTLADAINIYHPNTTLYYVPKQNALGEFNDEFGDELYMIEERVTSGHGDLKNFGYSNKIISTSDLLKKLRKSDKYSVDEDTYIRARLFDMLIGDWDRHEDQWRWAKFNEGKKIIYKPVPRDRDQAFSKYDGVILNLATKIVPALKLMQEYDGDIRNVKWFNLEPYPLDAALITKSSFSNWEKQVAYIQQKITDEIINNAFNNLPAEVQDATISDLKKKLKERLDKLPEIAKQYYKQLAKIAIVKGTDKDNLFEIKRLNNGNTSIKIFNIKKGKKGRKFYEKVFLSEETKEIWVYGLDDKDIFNVTGESKNKYISIKLIGGQNNDTYTIKNKKKVTIYDFKTKKNTYTNSTAKLKLTNNYNTNLYNYKKLKYNQNQLIPSIGSNPDDGLKIGINNTYTVYKFTRNPFTQQHTLKAAYYFATKGYEINYKAEFANFINQWNLVLETTFTSPNFSINHYGFGNETINYEAIYGDNYHRVKLSTYAFNPTLKWTGRMGAEFKIGAAIESIEVEKTANRYINTLPYILDERKNYFNFKTAYSYENYDDKTFPTLGMSTSLEAGWKRNFSNANEQNGYISPSISFNYKLIPNGNIVLATKFKSTIIIGNHFEFYNAASIGGKDGLRGYRNQRFIGNSSYYQNTDLRFHLKNRKTAVLPMKMGVFGGFDYGRVWLNGENSNDWKTSYGAGLWLVGAEMINLNLSVFNSKDGNYFNFNLGFRF